MDEDVIRVPISGNDPCGGAALTHFLTMGGHHLFELTDRDNVVMLTDDALRHLVEVAGPEMLAKAAAVPARG